MDVVLNITSAFLVILGCVFIVTGINKFVAGIFEDGIEQLLIGQATFLIGAVCITLAILLANVSLGNIV
jgi:hypothetical protein